MAGGLDVGLDDGGFETGDEDGGWDVGLSDVGCGDDAVGGTPHRDI